VTYAGSPNAWPPPWVDVWTMHVGKDDGGLPVYGYWIFG
jgi:hypothetical protein